jgi:hypothetical protein
MEPSEMAKESGVNILENWYAHYHTLSSDLNPKPTYRRDLVEFIYARFKDFWGPEFFQTTLFDALDQDGDYFLFSMLRTASFASFYFLTEIAVLLTFAASEQPTLLESLYSVRFMSDKSKECFFEIYVAFIFKRNNIPYSANIDENGAQKDGFADINGKQFLVECKKKYSVIADELSIRKFLMKEIIKILTNIPYGFEAIGVVNITAEKYNRALFTPLLKRLKNYLATRMDYHPKQLISDDNIRFELIESNDANKIALANHLMENTLYFTIHNLYKIDQGKPLFRVHLYCKAKAPGIAVANKLVNVLKKARKQQSGEQCGRIFILDNEYLNDFVSPLLHFTESYIKTVVDYLSKKRSDDIVVLLTRDFTCNTPDIKATVIGKDELQDIVNALRGLSYYSMDPHFFRRD